MAGLLKKGKQYKTKAITLRMTEQEHNDIKLKANIYTNGVIAEWLIYCSLNYKPRSIELIEEVPRLNERRRRLTETPIIPKQKKRAKKAPSR